MNLKFVKDDNKVSVTIHGDGDDATFSYPEFIKRIYLSRNLDDSQFSGDFSSEEKQSISDLIAEIVSTVLQQEETGGELISNRSGETECL